MHLAEISLNPTQHNRSIKLSFEIGTTRRNPCMHATLVKKNHLGKLKVALICICFPPNQQYKQTKSVELVSIAHIWTLYIIIFFIIAFTIMICFFSKILAQNKRSVISNVFAKNNRKFKNLKNPLVFYIFPSKISKKT